MSVLPDTFSDLEPYSDWCLAAEPDRWAKRLASTMPELQAFYDAVMPRAQAAIAYCDLFQLEQLPVDAANLLHLLYSFVTVSFAIECWRQPTIPDSGSTRLDLILAPGP